MQKTIATYAVFWCSRESYIAILRIWFGLLTSGGSISDRNADNKCHCVNTCVFGRIGVHSKTVLRTVFMNQFRFNFVNCTTNENKHVTLLCLLYHWKYIENTIYNICKLHKSRTACTLSLTLFTSLIRSVSLEIRCICHKATVDIELLHSNCRTLFIELACCAPE